MPTKKPVKAKATSADKKAMKSGTIFTVGKGHVRPDKPGRLRPWQTKAYADLKDSRLRLLIAPTGSGKSRVAQVLAVKDSKESFKALISCPQNIIKKGFEAKTVVGDNVTVIDGEEFVWNVCAELKTNEQLAKWIRDPDGTGTNNIGLTSHQMLVGAVKLLRASGDEDKLGTLALFIDETHHAASSGEANELGKVVTWFRTGEAGRLTLMTATFVRADREILNDDDRDRFQTHAYAIDKYLEDESGIKTIEIRYFLGDALESVAEIAAERRGQTITYLPGGSGHGGKKYPLARKVRKILLPSVSNDGKQIVDLVDERDRKRRVTELLNATKKPAHVIALRMGREGYDQPGLCCSIVMSPSASVGDVLQTMGRLLRKHCALGAACPKARKKDKKASCKSCKTEVQFNIIIDQQYKDPTPEKLKEYLRQCFVSLIIEEQFRPVEFKRKRAPRRGSGNGFTLQQQEEIMERIEDLVIEIGDEASDSIMQARLLKEGFDEDVVSWGIATFKRKYAENKKALPQLRSVSDVDLDIDLEKSIVGVTTVFTARVGHPELRNMREAMCGDRNPAEVKAQIREYYAKHKELPRPGHRLYRLMANYCFYGGHNYDQIFDGWCRSKGYGNGNPAEAKRQIREYYAKHKKLPPYGHELHARMRTYVKGGDCHDSDEDRWYRSRGFGRNKVKEGQHQIREYYAKHKKLPVKGHALYNRMGSYCRGGGTIFAAWCRSKGRRNGASAEAKLQIKEYYAKHKRLPAKGHELYNRMSGYCRKSGACYDSTFDPWCRSKGHGSRLLGPKKTPLKKAA